MSVSQDTVWEIRTAGADTNGGGFVTGAAGSDYSQQNTKNTVGSDISTTDAVAVGTAVITSATANFGTTIVGNIIYLQGGTGALAAGWYQVISRASTSSITVDRNVAAGTGITMNIGGALLSIGMFGGTGYTNQNKVWIKAGTYSITSATINIAGGCFSAASVGVFIEGYNSTRGDLGTKPLLQASGITNFTIITIANNNTHQVTNLKLDGISAATSRGLSIRHKAYKCEFVNFTANAFLDNSSGTAVAILCSASGCSSTAAFQSVSCFYCVAFNNTVTGFASNAFNVMVGCIADSNSGATSDGFQLTNTTGSAGPAIGCTSYNNGRDGFRLSATRGGHTINCIAETNAGVGFNGVNADGIWLFNCATYNNGTSVSFGTGKNCQNNGGITGSGTFFTDAPNQNFALNNTANQGALLRATGTPGTWPDITTTGYQDVGAVQHQDTGGGGGGATSAAYLG